MTNIFLIHFKKVNLTHVYFRANTLLLVEDNRFIEIYAKIKKK